MGIKSLEFFKSNNFANSIITEISVTNWDMDNEKYCSIGIEGDFVNNVLRHYDLVFTHRIKSQKTKKHDRSPEALLKNFDTRNGIVLADVSIDKRFKKYYVKMKLKDKERLYRLSFKCDIFFAQGLHYRGFDYTNVFDSPEYLRWNESGNCVFDEKYFEKEEETVLPDGYTLYEKKYLNGSKSELRKNGQCIYAYTSYDHRHRAYNEFIYHSNGHRYYPFHTDLYGISYIDIDTLAVFNYIPRGYDNNHNLPTGESFIILSVHYDSRTDLIAYNGCYWCDAFDIRVGPFDDPLNFDPHLISVSEYLDPEREELPEIYFESWDEDGLSVKCKTDDGEEIKTITLSVLNNEIEKLNKQEIINQTNP